MIINEDDRNPVEVLAEEFLQRRRANENVSISEYEEVYPELSGEVRKIFRAMLAMERFKQSTVAPSEPSTVSEIADLKQLGDFRILREIGRGGMGIVYEAEQQSLRRRVAVKVFPKKMLQSSRQLERFHREARTAAQLHHTNIVPVFGVGQHDDLHFFVMQRIDGVPLDVYITGMSGQPGSSVSEKTPAPNGRIASASTQSQIKPVSTDAGDTPDPGSSGTWQRPGDSARAKKSRFHLSDAVSPSDRIDGNWIADVGIQIAQAVAYAHRQNVLHRDIKPSNLILDPHGTVWVSDFGLATSLETGNAEIATEPGQPPSSQAEIAGTLRYMAPECFDGRHTVHADIYGLGLTLYELLTLQPAFFERSRLRLIERIQKADFPPPSQINPATPKDLEAIILKAVAFDPSQRYDSMDEFAQDLTRFTQGRPVHARRIGPAGRLWRWSRRSPIVAGLTATLALGAIVSFALVGKQWRKAIAENQRAEANLSLALESMDQILERFGSGWMAHPYTSEVEGDGETTTSDVNFQIAVSDHNAAVLQNALKFYDQFAAQNASNITLQRDTAKVHRRVGDIYDRLGQHEKAEDAYRRSLQILNADTLHQTSGDSAAELALEKAGTLNQMGLTLFAKSEFESAKIAFDEAQRVLENSSKVGDTRFQAELANTHNHLGPTLWLLGKGRLASQHHRQAVAILEKIVGNDPQDASHRLALAHAYRNVFMQATPWEDNREELNRIRSSGISLLESLVTDFPNVPDYQCELSEILTETYSRRCDVESEELSQRLRKAVSLARKLTQSHPTIPRYRAALGKSLQTLGDVMSRTDRVAANESLSQSVRIYRSLVTQFSDIPVYHLMFAFSLKDHGENLIEMEQLSEAQVVIQEAIEQQRRYIEFRPNSPFSRRMLRRLESLMAKANAPT
ncbi:serine/threonine-protein kinase [Stieleria varia]|uniref:Serine/threonine-protein kinase PrkC n=1 Tax=Stieleria varia TaxID=2528005 RepID=A0A5C6AU72_9BACT|nr:serine/threonine-protein kinase [Stieleria varia]TWU02562.1 Serine/threonine-protein kinase PrkC [Stieleria varia]